MGEASKDVNTYMMGVSGIGGVGKNTFVKEVGRKAMKISYLRGGFRRDNTMRVLASRLTTYLCRRRPGHVQTRNFSSHNVKGLQLILVIYVLVYLSWNAHEPPCTASSPLAQPLCKALDMLCIVDPRSQLLISANTDKESNNESSA
ncbi:hypothetical protein Pint_21587 [Pistacia integerrima]|uniref:Uncharacterized protein n=1 Tax=Pistacia integerrima TaxID=434235 RepID=A0ACC0XEV0_9ROSI|nr:hypothetical protein Pint_21587 [Pistacia integerrima]